MACNHKVKIKDIFHTLKAFQKVILTTLPLDRSTCITCIHIITNITTLSYHKLLTNLNKMPTDLNGQPSITDHP